MNQSHDIAVVGYGCRLPGANSIDAFWDVLRSKRCVVSKVSDDRWDLERFGHPNANALGKSYTWAAGQLDDVWGFDPAFFGISPREAMQMDPQQRILLQVVWEALEDAGIPPETIAGSEVGVYVGASGLDHANLFMIDPAAADAQLMTGNTLSIVSNRISYIYDLHGPSFTVDTACSSSLVALHEAAEAIRSGRIDTAIVGGVNLLLSPFPFIGFSRATMLSPTGLCRAFDAGGDGYVRSEGALAFVLQRADVARANRTPAHVVVTATGINSDGRTNGLSLPSSDAQAALLAQVYEKAEVDPQNLAFVEAHGTGTRAGDPLEARALGITLGQKRSAALPIGSVKTNIGHLEAGSGLAGLLKACLALEHDLLPASLHLTEPNPDIPFEDWNLSVATDNLPMQRTTDGRYAGVNSFGFGGANAHVILKDAEPLDEPDALSVTGPLVLSARSEDALKTVVESAIDVLDNGTRLDALSHALAYQKSWHNHRVVVAGDDEETAIAALNAYLEGQKHSALASGEAAAQVAEPVFVYTGNGAQWAGMGQAAYKSDEAFRQQFEIVDRQFMRLAGWSLLSTLFSEDLESEIDRTEVAQPLLFAIQVAITEALKTRGIVPGAVVGHSVGEVAAAWAAGALSLSDAVAVIHARSTHQEMTRHLGTMAAVLQPEEPVRAALAENDHGGVTLAAVNSPRSLTISGPNEAIDAFAKAAKKKRWAVRKLDLDYPFHCALVEPIREPLANALADLDPQQTTLPFYSTVSGEAVAGTELDAGYWWRNVRQPVLFMAAVEQLIADGYGAFFEIGPRPILTNYLRDTSRDKSARVALVHSLDSDDGDHANPLDSAVARALATGICGPREKLFGDKTNIRVSLPTYPWSNQPYQFETSDEATQLFSGRQLHLVGFRSRPEIPVWLNHIDLDLMPWLADHKVEETAVFPAAGFVDMAIGAGLEFNEGSPLELREFDILQPMVFDGQSTRETRIVISPETLTIEISSRPRLTHSDWTLHARGRLAKPTREEAPRAERRGGKPSSKLGREKLYELTTQFGLPYGPAFRQANRVDVFSDRFARVHLDAVEDDDRFTIRPTHLDAALHGFFALLAQRKEVLEAAGDVSFLPVRLRRLVIFKPHAKLAEADLVVTRADSLSLVADMEFYDDAGEMVARIGGIRFRRVALHHESAGGSFIYRTDAVRLPEPWDREHISAKARDAVSALSKTVEAADDEGWLLTEAAARVIAERAVREIVGDDSDLIDPTSLSREGRLAENATALFDRLMEILEVADRAVHEGSGWRLYEAGHLPPVEAIIETLLAEHPIYTSEATLLARAAEQLPRLLGEGLPDDINAVFSSDVWEQYRTATALRNALTETAERLLRQAVAAFPVNRPVDIVVVGADNAELARRFAPQMDLSRMRLTLADRPGRAFDRAKLIIGGLPGVSLQNLDDLASSSASFDIVVGIGVTADLAPTANTLADLRQLAVPDGLFLMLEPEPAAVFDVLGGLTSSWWRTRYDAVTGGSVLSGEDWQSAFGVAGYREVETLSLPTSCGGVTLVVAGAGERATDDAEEAAETETATNPSPVTVISTGDEDGKLIEAARSIFGEAGDSLNVIRASLSDDGTLVAPVADGELPIAEVLASQSPAPGHLVFSASCMKGDSDCTCLGERLTQLTSLLKQTAQETTPLWILTTGGARGLAGESGESAVQAGIWGFGRVATNEYPEKPIYLVDMAPSLSASEAAVRLRNLLSTETSERELIVDADGLWGLRARAGLPPAETSDGDSADAGSDDGEFSVSLDVERQGSLESLRWIRHKRLQLGAGDVEIEVAATGLNFRDVMWAQGLLPAEALEDGFAGPTLGMECAGRISRVGSEVGHVAVGDAVLAFAPACFASHVVVEAKAVARIPETVAVAEAATIPVAFLTTYYALVELAHLGEDETILIHGGAGGVGLAALQIAKWRGARVIATAGNDSKRALLRMLGADHVLDSRSLAFEDQVREITDGAGVDAVLNSLSGDAMERSIGLLRPFGRFLELGKRDYYANSSIGLRPFRQNLSYFGIDADQLLTFQPKLAARLLQELMDLFADGTLTPLPHRRFSADHITDAFRLMQKSGHIGKIVVSPPSQPADAVLRDMPVSSEKTYVLAGGLGGFGLETARWLIGHGARHVVLTGRRGVTTPEQEAAISRLREYGASVEGVACDITDEAAVAELITRINSTSAKLGGILHTAMVLDDGLIENLDRTRIDKVLLPKVKGAEVLDRLTRGLDLDLFVMFSSATTLVGNPGQANYVAANMYLEALARARRSAGEPALAVAWGAIADAGYLARNQDVDAVLSQRLGRSSLSAAQALSGLEYLLTHVSAAPKSAAVTYARIDWTSARKELSLFATPLFTEISEMLGEQADAGGEAGDIAALLEGLSPQEAVNKLCDVLAAEIGRILRMSADEISRHRPLSEIGMDSLMALELRMAAEQRLGIDIPLMSLSGGVTLNDLSAKIVARFAGSDDDDLSKEASALAVQHVNVDADADDISKAAEIVERKSGSVKDLI